MKLDGRAETEIRATAQECFAVLTDFERYPDWFGCERARVVARDPDTVELVYELVGKELHAVIAFHGEPPLELVGQVVEAHRRLKELDAHWHLESAGEGVTRVTYVLSVEMDVPLMVQAIARSKGRELMLEQPVRELRAQVESQRA